MKTKKLLVTYSLLLLAVIIAMVVLFKTITGETLSVRDYPDIAEEGVLRIVTEYNQSGYYVSGDTIEGFQYELCRAISDISGLEVQISLEGRLSDSFEKLSKGKYDVIAQNIPITVETSKEYLFTEPIVLNRHVLVQRKNDSVPPIRNHIELIGKEIYVKKDSPALLRLENLQNEIGGTLNIMEEETYSDEQLIIMVAKSEIDYAVCDHRIAESYSKLYPEIDTETNISFTQLQAWAVSQNAPILLDSLNSWLTIIREKGVYNRIYNRYYNK